MVITRVKSK